MERIESAPILMYIGEYEVLMKGDLVFCLYDG